MYADTLNWKRGPALLFCAVSLAVISVPWLGLLRQAPETLSFENRAISPAPAVPHDWETLQQWPKQFEAWFADRALGRETALAISRSAMFSFAGRAPTERVLLGRDGFIFFKGENALAFDQGFLARPGLSDSDLNVFTDEFRRRTEWFAAQGIAYFMMVVPEKFTVYPEYVPRRFEGGAALKRLQQIELAMRGTANFLSLRPMLLTAKSDGLVFYRTDSHWNGRGALVGYQHLIALLRNRWPELVARSALVPPEDDDYYVQDLATMVGRPELGVAERQEMAAWYRRAPSLPVRSRQLEAQDQSAYPADWAIERWSSSAPDLPIKALIFRDSTSVPLRSTLAEHFRETAFFSTHRYDKQTVLQEQPDVVIEIIVERGAGGLADGYFHLQEQR